MRKRNAIIVLIAVVFALMAIGCAPKAITPRIQVQNDAFGSKKKFAVVTIAGTKEFYGERGLTQMFKKVDNIPGANTQPIVDKLRPKVLKTLSKSKNFKLIPESKVLKSKAYKKMEEDPRTEKVLFFSIEMNTAKGYKYITSKEKMAQLAKALKVDGVIAVIMNFSIQSEKSGVNLAGFSLGKKNYKAVVTTTVIAYDRNGKMIWKDSTIKETQSGDSKTIIGLDVSDMTKTNFTKLHPKAIDMGEKTVGVLMVRLDDKLAGKKVSRVQNIRDESLYDDKKTDKKK